MAREMPMEFSVFKERCSEAGYPNSIDQTLYNPPQWIYAIRTNNGIKCEIKPGIFTVGLQSPYLEEVRIGLEAAGYEFSKKIGKYYNIDFREDCDIFEDFFDIVNVIENIESIPQVVKRTAARKIFTPEEAERNIFEKIAKRYRNAIDNKDQYMLDAARNLLSGDDIDHLLTVGESKKRTADNSYREHIVPCILVHNKAIDMIVDGASVTQVAQMIKNNLAIVLITNEEANHLDVELGMQTTMPDGWEFGGSVFARLDTAGITLK